jgi:putative membrane protein
MSFIIKILITALAIFITAGLLDGVKIKSFGTSILAALVLLLLNMTITPILQIISIPITIVTLGIFACIVNAFVVYLSSKLISGFEIRSFGWALIFALVLALVKSFLFWLF